MKLLKKIKGGMGGGKRRKKKKRKEKKYEVLCTNGTLNFDNPLIECTKEHSLVVQTIIFLLFSPKKNIFSQCVAWRGMVYAHP